VYHEVTVDGEVLIPVLNGAALARSRSTPTRWYSTRVGYCSCAGYTFRGSCCHERALRQLLGVDEDVPTYSAWLERRHAAS
jgi:hypothetical protein